MASDPRAEALMRALGGQGGPMPEEEMGAPEEQGPEAAAAQALSVLEPYIDEPRIAKAAQLLQEVAGGPSEPSEDTMPEGASAQPMPPQPGQ